MPDKWAQYAQPSTGDKWALYAQPQAAAAAPDFTSNPNGEGVYKMTGSGGQIGVPYSKVRAAQLGGFQLAQEDRDRYVKDYVAQPMHPVNPEPQQGFGDVLKGAGSEVMGIGKGIASLFAKPEGAGENLASVIGGPAALPLIRMGRGAVQSEKKAAGQVQKYQAQTAATPWSEPGLRLLSAAKTGATALSMLNPISPGGVAGINELEDEGKSGEALGRGLVDSAGLALPEVVGVPLKSIGSKLAPELAEAALNVRGADRAFGRTPGQAILDETKGVTPSHIAEQANSKVDTLSDELEDLAHNSTERASLVPAREAASDSISAAINRNNPATIKKMVAMGKQLGEDYEGNEFPEDVSPATLLHLKRGIGDLQTSWNPATATRWTNGQVGQVYHALDGELDRTIPEGQALNQRISTLMPVAQRATAAGLNAGLLQRVMGRFAAPTGALAGGLAGFHFGGLPGAAAGIVGPEILTNPRTLMMGARGIDRAGKFGKFLVDRGVRAPVSPFVSAEDNR